MTAHSPLSLFDWLPRGSAADFGPHCPLLGLVWGPNEVGLTGDIHLHPDSFNEVSVPDMALLLGPFAYGL